MIIRTKHDLSCSSGVEDIKRKISYTLAVANVSECHDIASATYDDIVRLRGMGLISLVEFINLLGSLDDILTSRFGRDVISVGEYDGFFICRAVRHGMLDGEENQSCGECAYLMVCERLARKSLVGDDVLEGKIADSFVILSNLAA